MAITINPSRINVQSGNVGGQPFAQRSAGAEQKLVVPAKAQVNNIPAPESLNTMIRSAVEAVRQGTFWERGTILNLVI